MNKWINEEIEIVKNNYITMTDEELHALIPNHSVSGIATKRKQIGCVRSRYRKYTFSDVISEFSKREDYVLLSSENEFRNCNSKIRYICKNHIDKGVQQITLNHLQNGEGCYYCGVKNTASKRMIVLDKTADEELCKSKNFEYIDTIRKNGKIVILFICNNHRELGKQEMPKTNMERQIKGCKYCSGKSLPEWYVLQKAKEINPHIQLLEPYINLTSKIKCFCTKHNCLTNKTMQQILKGQGCYYCGLEKLAIKKFLTINEYQEKVSLKHKNIAVLEYHGINAYAKFQCTLCGHIWLSYAGSMKQCPKCSKYYNGEKQISDIMDEWKIKYIQQFRFSDCKDKRTLPFDFFLPDNDICIEFDGIQHFQQVDGWTDLKIIQKHDAIKNKFCKENNLILIRIPYWECCNIRECLSKKFASLNILKVGT